MKHRITLLLTILIVALAHGQNKPGQPTTVDQYKRFTDSTPLQTLDIRERLVQLAIQNPSFEIADGNIAIAEYNLKIAKNSWLDKFYVIGNVNESVINGTSTAGNIYYPKVNVGVNLPLGTFSRRNSEMNIAKETIAIGQAQKNEKYREIRALVLTSYEDYLQRKALLELQNELATEQYTAYLTAQKQYADGEIKIDDLNQAYKSYNVELAKQRTLERDLNVSIIEIEKFIGVKFSDVLAAYNIK
ncbi:MAG: hypothetical protein C5B52_13280 [Bacteroidetes bacterium]|nr:MAG: hypothetical protein C5B52_13280 [Bacteroidota bacterium]